jgi:hypothetical protein
MKVINSITVGHIRFGDTLRSRSSFRQRKEYFFLSMLFLKTIVNKLDTDTIQKTTFSILI